MSLGRALLIVLVGLGLGKLPDAAAFGDAGGNAFLHAAEALGGVHAPNPARPGLGRARPRAGGSFWSRPAGTR